MEESQRMENVFPAINKWYDNKYNSQHACG